MNLTNEIGEKQCLMIRNYTEKMFDSRYGSYIKNCDPENKIKTEWMKLALYSNDTYEVFNNTLIGFDRFYDNWFIADSSVYNALYGARFMQWMSN